MTEAPSIAAALRVAAAQVSGIEPNPEDEYISAYGERPPQNLRQTVGYNPSYSYDDYLQWMNRNNLAAYPASGAHYVPQGAREGYLNYGLPPVIQQRSPYATAAFRSYVDPFGQMMVQPLVGFPSAYPHVLSGVPMNMNYGLEWALGQAPLGQGAGAFPVPYPQAPQAQKAAPAQPRRATGSSAPAKQTTPSTPATGQHWVHPYADPLTSQGEYVIVPDDFSQAAAHPAYEGQLRVNANWGGPGTVPIPSGAASGAYMGATNNGAIPLSPTVFPGSAGGAAMGAMNGMNLQPQVQAPVNAGPPIIPIIPNKAQLRQSLEELLAP